MEWNNYLSLIVLSLALFLGGLVYFKNPKSRINRYFSVFTLSLGFWIWTNFMTDISQQDLTVLLWSRLALVGPIILAPFFLLFSWVFPRDEAKINWIKYFAIFAPTVLLLIFTPTKLNIERVVNIPDTGPPEVQAGMLYYPFAVYLLAYMGTALVILYKKIKFSSPLAKMQIRFVFFGVISALILSVLTNVVFLLLGISQAASIGPLFSIIIVISIAYAIVKHRLFDIRVIIKRTFVYSILLLFVLATYSLIVFGFTTLFGRGEIPTRQEIIPNIIAAIAIALGFEPIRKWLESRADKFLYVGQYDQDEVLNKLGLTLASSVDLNEALAGMMRALTEAMRLNHAVFFVIKGGNKHNGGETKLSRIETVGIGKEKISRDLSSNLIIYFKTLKELIIREELEQELIEKGRLEGSVEGQIVKFMQGLGSEVAIPVFIKERLIGILLLSEKKSGDVFDTKDLNLLKITSLQTAAAIEKNRLYEEDQLKSEFVSIASHELLTPTAAIEGYLSMILDEKMAKVDAKGKQYLEKVYESSKRLSRLVRDLLNVSRIESGRLKIEPKKFDIVERAKQIIEELQPKAEAKNLELKFAAQDKGEVWADPERIHQVIYNLINNAIKYSEKGEIKVKIEKEGDMVKTRVIDRGIGISEKDLGHLFEKFYRVESKETTDIQGTGLGLYISHNIVELSGGQLEVESRLGQGSEFSFTLPTPGLANKKEGGYNEKVKEEEKNEQQ